MFTTAMYKFLLNNFGPDYNQAGVLSRLPAPASDYGTLAAGVLFGVGFVSAGVALLTKPGAAT